MKVLVIVNEAPWGGSLGLTALRVARALQAAGEELAAVFFREEGVYHASAGRAADGGTPDLCREWRALARDHGVAMLLCSSASQRRLARAPGAPFREAGLAEVMELMASCDRVVTF